MIRTALSAVLLTLALAGPALAQAVTPQGAAGLEKLLEQRLAEQSKGRKDGVRLDRAPDAVVRPAGAHYAVSIAELRLVTPGGWLVEAPAVEAQMTPRADGSWDVRAALPPTLAVFSQEGFRAGEVKIGEQQLQGRLTADLTTLEQVNARLAQVLFTPREGKGTIRLGLFAARMEPETHQDGKWGGPATVTVNDLSMRDPLGQERLALARLQGRVQVASLDTDKYAQLNAALSRRAAADDGRDGLSGAEATALRPAVPALDRLLSTLQATVDVSGFRMLRDDGGRREIAEGNLVLDLAGLASDRARLDLTLRHKGLVATGEGVTPGMVPGTGDVKVTALDLPRRALLDAFAQRLEETAKLGDAAAGKAFEKRALAALGAAQSSLVIDRLALDGADAALNGSGALRFDNRSPRDVTGNLALLLRGVDRLIAQVSAAADPRNPGTTLALYALQGLGKPESDRQGRPVLAYRLDMAPDGRILLNGNDATALVTGLLSLR